MWRSLRSRTRGRCQPPTFLSRVAGYLGIEKVALASGCNSVGCGGCYVDLTSAQCSGTGCSGEYTYANANGIQSQGADSSGAGV